MSTKVLYNVESVGESETFELPYGSVTIKITAELVPNAIKAFKKIEGIDAKVKSIKDKSLEEITAEEMQDVDIEGNMRDLLNEAFGTDICSAAFGEHSMLSLNTGNQPLFIAFADAFFPALEEKIKELGAKMQQKKPAVRPEVNKYLTPNTAIAGLAQPYNNSPLPDVSNLTAEQKKALIAQLIT